MRRGKIIALVIALVLILVGELYLFARCSREDMPVPAPLSSALAQVQTTSPPVSETMPPAPAYTAPAGFTSPPVYTAPPATQPPLETAPPTQPPATATPAPTPTPTPEPTATPQPTAPPTDPPVTAAPGTVVSSGSAVSSTGTNLNLAISWQGVDMGGGTTRYTVSGSIQSYSLQVISEPVTVSLGGYSTTVSGNAINVSDDSYAVTSLFTASLDVPTGTTGNLSATWNFQGSYSGVSLPTVTATGYVG